MTCRLLLFTPDRSVYSNQKDSGEEPGPARLKQTAPDPESQICAESETQALMGKVVGDTEADTEGLFSTQRALTSS